MAAENKRVLSTGKPTGKRACEEAEGDVPHLQNVRALFECRRACLYGFTCLRTSPTCDFAIYMCSRT